MANRESRWVCPSCFRCFVDANDLRDHLDFNKVVVRRLLKNLINALNHTGCPAYRAELCLLGEPAEELAEKPSTDQSTQLLDEDTNYEHYCPDQNCQDRKPFSKKTNLIRHFRIHVNCDVRCACGAVYSNADNFFRHLSSCQFTKDTNIKTSKTTAQQWEIIGLKERLLDQVRLELEQRLGATNDIITPDLQPRLEEGNKKLASGAESAHARVGKEILRYPPRSAGRWKKRRSRNTKRDRPSLARAITDENVPQQLQALPEDDYGLFNIPDQPARLEYGHFHMPGENGNTLSVECPAGHHGTEDPQELQSEVTADQQIHWEQRADSNFACLGVRQVDDDIMSSNLPVDLAMAVIHPPDVWPDFEPRNTAGSENVTTYFDPTIWPSDAAM